MGESVPMMLAERGALHADGELTGTGAFLSRLAGERGA